MSVDLVVDTEVKILMVFNPLTLVEIYFKRSTLSVKRNLSLLQGDAH